MKRLLWTSLMGVLIFVGCTLMARSATTEPPMEDLLTTDLLGYTCVAEEDLDAAFLNQGKGGSVPQTCITEAPSKDCATLEPLLGHQSTSNECATYAYRWLTWSDPDRSTGWGWDCGECTVHPYVPPPAAVPVPASWLLLIAAIMSLPLIHAAVGLKILENLDEDHRTT